MAIRSQTLTADLIRLEAADGRVFEYTSQAAAKHGTPEAAREAIYAAIQQALPDEITDRCLYLGIDDQFRFTALEWFHGHPEMPPPPREVSVSKEGDILITAWDGKSHTILASEIKQTPDAKGVMETKMAELLTLWPDDAKYEVAITTDANSEITELSIKGVDKVDVAPKETSEKVEVKP